MRPILMSHCPEVNPMVSISKEQEYRAIILEQKSTIYFGLLDLIDPGFTIREILIPWLQAGNKPDRFTGIHDKTDSAIFEKDILTNSWGDILIVEYHGCQWHAKLIKRNTSKWTAQYLHCEYMGWVVIGDIHRNPKLLRILHESNRRHKLRTNPCQGTTETL